jgi:DinB superfamily/Pentapeptide repeats (8 copies)
MTGSRPYATGSRVDGVDLSGVHLHGATLEGARLTDAELRQADLSGDITGMLVNGVEIAPLVEAELDRRSPGRVLLRATDIEGLRAAWAMLERMWELTTARASELSPAVQTQRVDDEWSFVETLRHLIFATDCWLLRAVQLDRHPYHPWGLPGADPEWANQLGLDIAATAGLAEVLPVRREHQMAVRGALSGLTDHDLADVRTAPDVPGHPNGDHSVLQCLHVILREEWEHHTYAVRDLDALGGAGR